MPIPGTRRVERLDENIAAVDVDLSPDELREIDSAASQIEVQEPGTPTTSND